MSTCDSRGSLLGGPEDSIAFSFEGLVREGLKGIKATVPSGKKRSPGLGCSLTTVPFGTSMSRLSIFGVFYFCLFSCECLACKSLI